MFELRVLNGLHQGAALPLIGEQWLIGANDELDLALHDAGVEQRHGCLKREGERWVLNAEEGVVLDEEGHPLSPDDLYPNRLFVIGSVWLTISAAQDAWPVVATPTPDSGRSQTSNQPTESTSNGSSSKPKTFLFSRMTTIALGVLLGVVGSAWSISSSGPASAVADNQAIKQNSSAQATSSHAAPQRLQLSDEEAMSKLKTMLSDRLLTDIAIESTPDGLVLRGSLEQEAHLVYARMLQRFKDRYETKATLIDEVSVGGASLPFAIVQIMSGPHAHIVTAEGKRLYVGDELDGIRLTRIDDGRLEFQGERRYEVVW
ncbi:MULTISPECIES: FHA domain-containing protein [Pseudomonas]|uniref:Type III secretion protein D n=1 Tax=Pseudomonas lutea TaxID=243924 RepID=A0A9X8MD76_9PSED|nr:MULTISPECIES: FHA domain-containing protein [Pseudomonas]SEQ63849.1 type III secretion protein D [Pseudomonas lutea]